MFPTRRRFLGFLYHNLFIFKSFCNDNDNFWCEQPGKSVKTFMARKIQGVQEILIGPVGQYQSVTKGVQIVQRGFLDAQTRNNATLALKSLYTY